MGIGTTNPASKLEVVGDITVRDDNWLGIGSALERIAFDADGDDIELLGANVGIGTTNPSYALEVVGDARVYPGNDFYVGNVGLNDQASLTSGASSWDYMIIP